MTLYVPGLFGPGTSFAAADVPRLPILEKLLARGQHCSMPPATYHAALGELFGLTRAPDRDLPIAALTRLADAGESSTAVCASGVGAMAASPVPAPVPKSAPDPDSTPCRSSDPSSEVWMRADPVHLRVDRIGLTLLGAEQVDLSLDEARQLAVELQAALPAQVLQLEVRDAGRWYLRLERVPEIMTRELDTVLSRDIQQALPAGPERKHWHQLSNEIQMALHEAPVNQTRERSGRAPINSLWFWGAGSLPEVRPVSWSALVGEELYARGLAQHHRVPCYSTPRALRDAAAKPAAANVLAVYPACKQALEQGRFESWQSALLQLEQDWLAPIDELLRKGRIQVLTLRTDGDLFALTRRDLWRVWRRVRPFAGYLAGPA